MDELERALLADPALSDVPKDATLDELRALRAAERGEALTLALCLMDGRRIDVVVPRRSNVLGLKRAVQRRIERDVAERGRGHQRSISWKAHWKDWCLVFDGQKLTDNRAALSVFGMTSDGCELRFHSLRADRVAAHHEQKRNREAARTTAAIARARTKAFDRRR